MVGEDETQSARGRARVKGVWFVTARRQLLAEHGPEVLARIADRMGEEHAPAMRDPIASSWYAETTFQRAMAAVADETCGGDPERFVDFIEASTVLGINRFMRIVLSLTSPAYLLRKMPVLWAQHRRANGTLEVELGAKVARLHYKQFPFFDDRNYRLFVRGVLRKTVEVSSGVRPDVTIRDYAADSLVVEVFFTTRALLTR